MKISLSFQVALLKLRSILFNVILNSSPSDYLISLFYIHL